MGWRIYYDDGATFDDTQGDPDAAPAFGIVCIVQPDADVGRMVLQGWDWYYWEPDDGLWWGSDVYGVLDRLLHRLPVVALGQGRLVASPTFRTILQRAIEDPDFPIKSATRRFERPSL
jgi:hypothetical protein